MAENNTNAPLIETSAVGFTYQGSETPALQDVTLSIGAGECVLLCGKSGCGKTTTLRIIAGFEEPSGGEVLFNGIEISKLPPYKREVNTGRHRRHRGIRAAGGQRVPKPQDPIF